MDIEMEVLTRRVSRLMAGAHEVLCLACDGGCSRGLGTLNLRPPQQREFPLLTKHVYPGIVPAKTSMARGTDYITQALSDSLYFVLLDLQYTIGSFELSPSSSRHII